jgi:hypothetical protein
VPGVQNVIGTYYSTILRDCALENCTEVNTKSEQAKGVKHVANVKTVADQTVAGTVSKFAKIEMLTHCRG